MAKNKKITVQGTEISVLLGENDNDYICLTNMVKSSNKDNRAADIIKNWIRNRSTIEFLGAWETVYNPNFKVVEFDHFRKSAGLPTFTMSVNNWVEETNAIGIYSKSGRYGGTYAHKDIAFEFGAAISPMFKLFLIKDYQRLKEVESNPLLEHWDVKRLLTKVNYAVQTDTIKDYVIPKLTIEQTKKNISNIYASEADMLNLALFGYTAKDWAKVNPNAAKNGLNVRDYASINQLIVLAGMEAYNSEMIKEGKSPRERFVALHKMAKEQLISLNKHNAAHKFRKLSPGNDSPLLE